MILVQSVAAVQPRLQAQVAGRSTSWNYGRSFLLLLLIPALLYPLAFVIVLLPSYEHWATTQFGPELEYGFDSRPTNADVVIFGDSSAFLGIDPRIVNAGLRVKSIVLPGTVGSIPVTGDASLQNYLAHNRPPRLIVFYFSAWNLDLDHLAKGRFFEGEEMMLRHMSAREIAGFAVHHPAEALEFPFRLYSTFGPKMLQAALHHVDREQATADALGHVDYRESFSPLEDSCMIPAGYLSQASTRSVSEFTKRYASAETQVMVYLAPVPSCRNADRLLQRSFATVGALPPKVLPAGSFAADPYYAHILPASVPLASETFARALEVRLSKGSAARESGAYRPVSGANFRR